MVLRGGAGERQQFVSCLHEFCAEHSVGDAARSAMDLALEEHLTNVLSYGYEPGAQRTVTVRIGTDNTWLWAEVKDDGIAYNPLTRPPVDVSIPLEEKPIGGLGVHLIRQFMDELDYARESEHNVLRLRKRLHETGS